MTQEILQRISRGQGRAASSVVLFKIRINEDMKTMVCISPFHSISLATLLSMPSLGSLHHLCLLWAIFNVVPSLEDHHVANTIAICTGEFWQLQLKKIDDVDNALKSVKST